MTAARPCARLAPLIALALLCAACATTGPTADPAGAPGAPASEPAAGPTAAGSTAADDSRAPAAASIPTTAAPPTETAAAGREAGGAELTGCLPTQPDGLGPFYEPGAPERDRVGTGYVLFGRVVAAGSCAPVAGAQVELWMAGPGGVYTDDYRAIVRTDSEGAYRFESHVPVAYGGRPPHIHLRVTASGHGELVTQHYPEPGAREAEFAIVLPPG